MSNTIITILAITVVIAAPLHVVGMGIIFNAMFIKAAKIVSKLILFIV